MKNENENTIDPFKVYVRVRPLLERELNIESDKIQTKSSVSVAVSVDNNTVNINNMNLHY